VKFLALAVAIALVAASAFIYAGISTLCDDDYWPDW